MLCLFHPIKICSNEIHTRMHTLYGKWYTKYDLQKETTYWFLNGGNEIDTNANNDSNSDNNDVDSNGMNEWEWQSDAERKSVEKCGDIIAYTWFIGMEFMVNGCNGCSRSIHFLSGVRFDFGNSFVHIAAPRSDSMMMCHSKLCFVTNSFYCQPTNHLVLNLGHY